MAALDKGKALANHHLLTLQQEWWSCNSFLAGLWKGPRCLIKAGAMAAAGGVEEVESKGSGPCQGRGTSCLALLSDAVRWNRC